MSGLELIIGPMFSGKTTEMITRCRLASLSNKPTLIIKYLDDCRYGTAESLSSHADVKQSSSDMIRVVSAKLLSEIVDVPEMVIGIDEGQFYPDLIERCDQWLLEGKRIIVSALDGDYMQRPFGQICNIIPKCEYVKKKTGICMKCRNAKSAFTKRTVESTEVILVGAQESYIAVCRTCL